MAELQESKRGTRLKRVRGSRGERTSAPLPPRVAPPAPQGPVTSESCSVPSQGVRDRDTGHRPLGVGRPVDGRFFREEAFQQQRLADADHTLTVF